MSVPEKFQLMEALWQNLTGTVSEIESPAWHGDVLAERERLTFENAESFVDWETAKSRLRSEML